MYFLTALLITNLGLLSWSLDVATALCANIFKGTFYCISKINASHIGFSLHSINKKINTPIIVYGSVVAQFELRSLQFMRLTLRGSHFESYIEHIFPWFVQVLRLTTGELLFCSEN